MPKKRPQIIELPDGTQLYANLVRIVERNELGEPLLLRVYKPDEKIQLSKDPDANHFKFAYMEKSE